MGKLKIGITGATGLIGSKLCEYYCSKGHEVSIITRSIKDLNFKNIKIYETDLSSPDVSKIKAFTKNLDFLFHLASELNDDSKMMSTNYQSTKLLSDLLINTETIFVFMSSIGVFDFNSGKMITEDGEKSQLNYYEETKFLSEKYIYKQKINNLKFIIIRPSIILDLKMKSKIIKYLINLSSIRIKLKISKSVIGNFVLSNDIIKVLTGVVKQQNAIGESFNISSNVSLKEFITEISNTINKKPYILISMNIFLFLVKIFSLFTNRKNFRSIEVFFSNTSKVSSNKIENFLDFKICENFSSFLKAYIEKK